MPIKTADRWGISQSDCDRLRRGKLLSCPLCNKSGFSLSGLQQHRCPRLPSSLMGLRWYSDRLTHDQVRNSVLIAIHHNRQSHI